MFEYSCKVRRVIDGDTVDIDIDLGFSHWIHGERIRLDGIDTPECRTTDPDEKYFGNLAKEYVLEWIEQHGPDFRVKTTCKDKYGRYLGQITTAAGRVLNDELVENHLAVPYEGQSKEEIEELHIANRNMHIKQRYDLDAVVDKIAKELIDENQH